MSFLRSTRLLKSSMLAKPAVMRPAMSQMRLFSNDADAVNRFKRGQVSRISVEDEHAGELISAIRNKRYDRALQLVNSGRVHVDGHTPNENTALTDAALHNDVRGARFLLETLKANPNACCHCPAFRTALHYAATHGHEEMAELLIKSGASVNALDANGYTALDMVPKKEASVKQLLIENGARTGKEVKERPMEYVRRLG